MKYDFLVIGGGAAGMMAAGHAAELGLSACASPARAGAT